MLGVGLAVKLHNLFDKHNGFCVASRSNWLASGRRPGAGNQGFLALISSRIIAATTGFTILRSNPAPSIHFTLTSSTNLRADRKPQLD